jgi:signal transduction histidine kinase/CheY-like chemotaxis protein
MLFSWHHPRRGFMDQAFTILVVDDSPTQVALLKDALEHKGFTVEKAKDGMEAIAKVYQIEPDLVLSDIIMPELNGYHLCRVLKNDPVTAQIPVVLLTNLTEQHDRFWGKNAGADLYLEKTSDIPRIADAVENMLDGRTPGPRKHARAVDTLNKDDIQARITDILDRLLYESTISNEILKFTSLTHDTELLSENLLRFLGDICRHDAAGLLLRQGRDKLTLAFSINQPMPAGFIAAARDMMIRQIPSANTYHEGINGLFIFPENPPLKEDLSEEFHTFHTLPIRQGDETFGLICLFNRKERALTEGIAHALGLVADRFEIVARYINKLNEIEEIKADFISMLVHDLRSPLTSIRGFSEVLSQEVLGSVNEDQKSALCNIQSGSNRLLSLIEDILHLSKLEAGKMTLTPLPVSIREIAQETSRELAALFMEKNLSVDLQIEDDLPIINADGQQLGRVLTNLLTNAAKFSPRDGCIRLLAYRYKTTVRVDVEDHGPGIPPQQQKGLFGRYQQIDSGEPKSRKGTGLGLAICKEIVRLHQGSIWVESPIDDDTGSRFSFTLPLPDETSPS